VSRPPRIPPVHDSAVPRLSPCSRAAWSTTAVVGVADAVDVGTGPGNHQVHRLPQPAVGLVRRQVPGAQPEVHPLHTGQVGQRDRRDVPLDLPHPLGQGRFRDAGRPDDERPDHRAGSPGGEPRNDLVLQQHPHLERHAGQHDDETGRTAQPEAWRGPPPVPQDDPPQTSAWLRLLPPARGRTGGTVRPGLPDRLSNAGVSNSSATTFLLMRPGRSQPSGRQHRAGAAQCLAHGGADRLRAVGHRGAPRDPHAQSRQTPGDLGAVGVDREAEQQLGADGDELDVHASAGTHRDRSEKSPRFR
jgi:hypothetical protein